MSEEKPRLAKHRAARFRAPSTTGWRHDRCAKLNAQIEPTGGESFATNGQPQSCGRASPSFVIPRRLRRRGISGSGAALDLEIPWVASAPLGMTQVGPRNANVQNEATVRFCPASAVGAGIWRGD